MARSVDISIPISISSESHSYSKDEFKLMNQTAKTSGLTSDNLLILCDWMESEKLDEKHKLKIIECFIPTTDGAIPEEVCFRLACLLKASKTTLATKVEILKWMVSAHSIMETSGRFQMLYEMILMLLKNSKMRSYAAQLLCAVTQKKQVTVKRLSFLLSFQDEFDQVPAIALLLHLFFLHSPELFEDDLNYEYTLQFEPLDPYPNLIKNVHPAYAPGFPPFLVNQLGNNSPTESPFLVNQLGNNSPTVSEFDNIVDKSNERIASEPSSSKLSTVSSVKKHIPTVFKSFKALQQSKDISKILQSEWRRLFFTSDDIIHPKSIMQIKIQDYIISMFHDSFDSEDIVDTHSELFRLQRSFPGISEFTEFLLSKNDWSPDILEVMCFEPMCCFKKIANKLQVIKEKFLTTEDVGIKCQWLISLSKMLCYWILQSKKSIPGHVMCNDDDSDVASDNPLFHFASTEIRQLGSEIDFLCESFLMEDCSPFVLSQILQNYQMDAIACQQMAISSSRFPPASVFQLSLFSLSTFLLETLSGFMLRVNAICDLVAEECVVFRASLNDVKKIFFGGSYKSDNTYLAKTKAFKKFIGRRNSDLKRQFILHKHPAFLLIAMEFGDGNYPKDFLSNPDNRKQFFAHLVKKECKDFVRLILKIT